MEDRSLRDSLLECVDDLEGITKQIVESLLNRDKQNKEGESLTNLATLYEGKQKEMSNLAKRIPEFQEREKLIRELKGCVEQRDEVIMHVEELIRGSELAVMTSVCRNAKRLQSVRQSERCPIDSEELIKFSHQISRNYSIATPHFWKLGDAQRPFPIEPEFRASRLSAPRSAATAANPTSSTIRPNAVGQISTPPAHLGRMASPLVTNPAVMSHRNWGSPSPRTNYPGSSPRGRPHMTTPGGSSVRGAESSPFGSKKYSTDSPGISSPSMAIQIQSTVARPMQQVRDVENMSSGSSDSSSSDDES